MTRLLTPRGWHPASLERRFTNVAPSSYDEIDSFCECNYQHGRGGSKILRHRSPINFAECN